MVAIVFIICIRESQVTNIVPIIILQTGFYLIYGSTLISSSGTEILSFWFCYKHLKQTKQANLVWYIVVLQ